MRRSCDAAGCVDPTPQPLPPVQAPVRQTEAHEQRPLSLWDVAKHPGGLPWYSGVAHMWGCDDESINHPKRPGGLPPTHPLNRSSHATPGQSTADAAAPTHSFTCLLVQAMPIPHPGPYKGSSRSRTGLSPSLLCYPLRTDYLVCGKSPIFCLPPTPLDPQTLTVELSVQII